MQTAHKPLRLVLVGIGASAGGLEALFEFLGAVPRIPGAAFVIVVHQDPERHTQLPELLSARTSYPVSAIESGQVLEAEHVYVAPPAASVGIADGAFTLEPFANWKARAKRIDSFFRSAAAAFGERTAAIVLSGNGSDGSEGVRAVAAARGLTLAQDPATALHRTMPKSAIATGVIHYVAGPAQMPAKLLAHFGLDGHDYPLGKVSTG
jgi:two-component system CheB/CheR fusion protein